MCHSGIREGGDELQLVNRRVEGRGISPGVKVITCPVYHWSHTRLNVFTDLLTLSTKATLLIDDRGEPIARFLFTLRIAVSAGNLKSPVFHTLFYLFSD